MELLNNAMIAIGAIYVLVIRFSVPGLKKTVCMPFWSLELLKRQITLLN